MDQHDGSEADGRHAKGIPHLLFAHVAFVVLLSVAAAGLYVSTLHDLKRLQPGYPQLIVLSVATPPAPFRIAHAVFPMVLIIGSIAFGVAVIQRSRVASASTAQRTIFLLHPIVVGLLVLVFLWASVWASRVMRYLGEPYQ